jgi:hypothetical protein
MKRLVILLPVLLAFQVGVQPALAWTWPVDGPVLRPFVLGDNPYAAGQHRGIDIGAPTGTTVRAPAAGTVSFAGTVPTGGRTLTIRTSDGYSVTLLHLGTIRAVRGAAVSEGDPVGTVGPSGVSELAEPYVYLGIRVTADANGYVDPLRFLPAASAPAPAPTPAPAPVEQPSAAGAPTSPGRRRSLRSRSPIRGRTRSPSRSWRPLRWGPRASVVSRREVGSICLPTSPSKGLSRRSRCERAARMRRRTRNLSPGAPSGTRLRPRGPARRRWLRHRVPAAGGGGFCCRRSPLPLLLPGYACAASSLMHERQTERPRYSSSVSRRPQKTQAVCGLESRMVSSLTEISSGSFSPRPKRFRISIGITIRPSSSMCRMIPVLVTPRRVRAAVLIAG